MIYPETYLATFQDTGECYPSHSCVLFLEKTLTGKANIRFFSANARNLNLFAPKLGLLWPLLTIEPPLVGDVCSVRRVRFFGNLLTL